MTDSQLDEVQMVVEIPDKPKAKRGSKFDRFLLFNYEYHL